MSKVIFIEGPDGVGKTTCINKIKEIYPSIKVIRKPNNEGPLGFLREELKYKNNIDLFGKQALFTCSHIVDAYRRILPYIIDERDIIIDRSHLSSYVYGKYFGLSKFELDLLLKINKKVFEDIYYNTYKENYTIELYNIFLDSDKKLSTGNEDLIESNSNWNDIRNLYLYLYEDSNYSSLINPIETNHMIKVSTGNQTLTKDEVVNRIIDIVSLGK